MLLLNYDKIDMSTCEHYLTSKSTKKPFGKGTKEDFLLQLVYFDICGLMNVKAKHKAYYFITFINGFTCFDIVYLITHKLDVINYFQSYMRLVANKLKQKN